jgi:ankyrin repeat protein
VSGLLIWQYLRPSNIHFSNPTGNATLGGYEYGMLAAKLQHQNEAPAFQAGPSAPGPVFAELPGDSRPPQELPGSPFKDTSIYSRAEAFEPTSPEPDDVITPSVSEMSISDRVPEPSIVSSVGPNDSVSQVDVLQGMIPVEDEEASTPPQDPVLDEAHPAPQEPEIEEHPASTKPIRIHVDRSKLAFRVPKQTSGAGSVPLKKALLSAVSGKKPKVVEQLLDRGVSPDTGPEENALIKAVVARDMESLKLLLDFGANPDATATDGKNPLRCACERGHEPEVKLLLEYGANPNLSSPSYGAMPYAILRKYANIVHLLLQYGADPNLVMKNGDTSMVYACSHDGEPNIIQEMIDYGAGSNVKNASGHTPLYAACKANKPDTVRILLAHGADPNMLGPELPIVQAVRYSACLELLLKARVDLSKRTGIMELATVVNNIESVKLLLDAGVDPNEKSNAHSPLTTAIRDNRSEIFKLLLLRGADPNVKGQEMPLLMASLFNKPDYLKLLLENGADLKKCSGVMEKTVAKNSIECVTILLDAGVDPNEKSGVHSPLTTAIRENHPEISALLLSRGADPNLKGQEMPLTMAVRKLEILQQVLAGGADLKKCPGVMESAVYHNSIESVKILLDIGVDPNEKRQGTYTPLGTAVRDNHPEIAALLLSRGADPNLKGQELPIIQALSKPAILKQLIEGGADVRQYKGILEAAVNRNNIESVNILLDAGVPIDEKHNNRYTPLITAIRDNHIPIAAHLIAKGADANASGETLPIIMAARFADTQRLKMVLDAGADVNKQFLGQSTLMEACERNHKDSVALLLERKADVNAVNDMGSTAMDIAANKGNDEIVMMLLDAMG